MRKVLLASVPSPEPAQDGQPAEQATRLSREREVVLGAALNLVAKMPDKCRDTHGFVDGRAIVSLIQQTAARWFADDAPGMSSEEMAELIDKYLE